MLPLYLGALVVGFGVLGVQLFAGHDASADASFDGSVDGSVDSHAGDGDHGFGALGLIASLRFWSFGLLAFGLVGSLLQLLGLAGAGLTAGLAIAVGLAAGLGSVTVIRRLGQESESSHTRAHDAVGKLGRVIVPLEEGGRGKVRVQIKGAYVDYIARADEPIGADDAVVVEEATDGEVVVSRAPNELKP